MEELETIEQAQAVPAAETVTLDPFSEAAIIASLPPEARGEFKRFGVMEDKSGQEIHDIMLLMRETYAIPPWHPFTYLMKFYARGDGHGRISSEIVWCVKAEKKHFDIDAVCGKRDWVNMRYTFTKRDGTVIGADLCVCPSKELIWSLRSELPVVRQVRAISATGGVKRNIDVCREELFEAAAKLLAEGKFTGELNHIALPREVVTQMAIERKRQNATMRNNMVVRQPKKKAPKTEEPPTTKEAKMVSKELLMPMFELACVKARELGMTETISMWKKVIDAL